MAEQDNSLVTVHLDEVRAYRDRETYQVIEVGPGRAKLPAYVAKKWKLDISGAHKSAPENK